MADVRIDIATQFTGKKAFKQAETATDKLNRGVKNLARNVGLAFGTAAIVAYGRASVKAALESQAEQERLANLLEVTTGASRRQIDALNQQASALEKIGVVTAGSITQTQSQLATFNLQISTIEQLTPAILDYVTAEKGATATTEQFKSMTNGLAQALNGNFTSLTRVGFVIDDVTKKRIKEGTETERAAALVEVLNSTYKDFNKNLRLTSAGQMQVLANTANDVKVIIGTGILDSLKLLSDDQSVDSLTTSMTEAAEATAETTVAVSKLIKEITKIPVVGDFLGRLVSNPLNLPKELLVFGEGGLLDYSREYGKLTEKIYGGAAATKYLAEVEAAAAKKRAEADRLANAAAKKIADTKKKQLATEKALLAEKKKQEALDKAALVLAQGQKVFDEEGIQLAAAAQGKLTDEERVRIALKKDILDLESAINEGNVTAAARLANSMVANAQKLAALRTDMIGLNDIQNPFDAWLETLRLMAMELAALSKPLKEVPKLLPKGATPAEIMANIEQYQKLSPEDQTILFGSPLLPSGSLGSTMSGTFTEGPDAARFYNQMSAGGSMGGAGTVVNVNVTGSVTTERDLVAAITQGLYAQQASGTPVNYSTAY
jgi:hypothetical protein